jgi:hypothetical protein
MFRVSDTGFSSSFRFCPTVCGALDKLIVTTKCTEGRDKVSHHKVVYFYPDYGECPKRNTCMTILNQ